MTDNLTGVTMWRSPETTWREIGSQLSDCAYQSAKPMSGEILELLTSGQPLAEYHQVTPIYAIWRRLCRALPEFLTHNIINIIE